MTTSHNTWVCIMLFVLGSVSLTGCLYTQPMNSYPQQTNVQSTRPDSVASAPSTALDSMAISKDSLITLRKQDSLDSPVPSRRALLLAQADEWAGTPHRWGGNSRSGIDCSALVQKIYNESFHTSLPRTTREQVRIGKRISVSKLEVGDLVFYRINSRTRHVGVFIGDNSFLHSSKSEGVAISSLDTPYWKSRFWMARRILPQESTADEPASEQKRVQLTW